MADYATATRNPDGPFTLAKTKASQFSRMSASSSSSMPSSLSKALRSFSSSASHSLMAATVGLGITAERNSVSIGRPAAQ